MLVQSSRLAEFGGCGMSFNIRRGTLGSLAMFTAIRNASSRVSRLAVDRRQFSAMRNVAIDVVDGARSRHRSAIGWLRRNAPH